MNPTCPKLPDGRAKHYFNKVSGIFRCARCGTKSNPAQRWEPKARAHV